MITFVVGTGAGWAMNNLLGLLLGILADLSSERAWLVALGVVIAATSVLLATWRARVEQDSDLAQQPA